MSFFDRLRKGVHRIENEVKTLKEITEDGQQLSEEQLMEDLMKAKKFESEVRQTYVEVTQLHNQIKSSGDPLLVSKNRIRELRQMLIDIEENSGLKNYGYQSFSERYSIDSSETQNNFDDNTTAEALEATEMDREVKNTSEVDREMKYNSKVDTEVKYRSQVVREVKTSSEMNKNPKTRQQFEEYLQRDHNLKYFPKENKNTKSNLSEEKTSETVRFAPDITEVPKREPMNSRHTYGVKTEDKSDEKITKKYDKLLTRTPQLYDFGITRRFTILPPVYNKPDTKSSPEEPTYNLSQTCRFNYMNNGFNMASNAEPITPPNPDISHNSQAADSFVTVEFTPGLTTKRPKGISRMNNDYNKKQNNCHQNKPKEMKEWSESSQNQRLPQSILQSVENDSKVTPEQPIPSSDAAKSTKLLKSIGGKASGTPPLPKSRVDANFHHQILKNL